MITSIKSFLKSWEYESSATLKLLERLTDDSLTQEVYPGGRTLGKLANHILETLTELPAKLNLGIEEKHANYASAAEIAQHYKVDSDSLVNAIKTRWTDADLLVKTNMYGEDWPNGVSLNVLILHQCHHRGQMTVLMRQAGIIVPGIYGPAKEEWTAMGMAPME
ncbi:MAG TPA: DinB family protein [Chitinophagaceae bacterium]|nr:DinB family protein [Chitinophagaceae bacterium]